MPLHRDATYVNLHPPLGASLDTSDQPLNLLESAYAQHWRNHNARDVLLLDTSFANLTAVYLGNATDPAALVLPGASEIQAQVAVIRQRGSDPAAPTDGVRLYSKESGGVDHLFVRNEAGTVYQLTPLASGSFDPEDIALADNTADALDIYEGANKYLTVATTNGSEAIAFGNATTNPAYSWLGSGAWTVGGGVGTSGQVLTSNGAGVAPTWQTVSGGSFDPEAITLADNTSGALLASEGANDYLRVNTTDAAESIILGNATTNPSFSLLGTGALLWNAARQITLPDNTANVFRLMEGANEYFGLATTNGSEAIRFGNTTTNPSVTFAGSGALTLPTGGVSIPDNSATAFRVLQGANSYLAVDTTDSAEVVTIGNATTNPVIALAGTGLLRRSIAGNLVIGDPSVLPSGSGVIGLTDKVSGTWTGSDHVVIGTQTGNLSGARFIAIARQTSGAFGADSITLNYTSSSGATGSRAIQIGGAGNVTAADSISVGYGSTCSYATSFSLGRASSVHGSNQAAIGGSGFPLSDIYIGEATQKSTAFTATAITIQPTEGTGSDRDGLPLTLYGGRGTGTGNAGPTNGSLTLATYPSTGSSGTTQHTATPRVRVRADGVRLSSSHNTMSTAAERDEAEHFQTGAVDMPTASTTYTVLTIAPENTANDSIYTVEGVITGYADTTPAVRISFFYRLTFECVSGTPSIIRYWVLDMETGTTGWVSGSPSWADVSGSTVRIRVSTAAGQTDGRAIATARWHGVEL